MAQTVNGTLQAQVDGLHTEVRKIAETMITIRNTEKVVDQKANVIGKALIEQKKSTEAIFENQAEMEERVLECKKYGDARRDMIVTSVDEVKEALGELRDMEKREDNLLNSLNQLSANQTSFMKANMGFAKKADDDLNAIKSAIDEIKKVTVNMSIIDQVTFMNAKAEEIHKALESYISTRTKTAAAMEAHTRKTEERIDDMKMSMERQWDAVNTVVEISSECEQKTKEMCEKLEELLARKTSETPMSSSMSLEEMFAPPASTSPVLETFTQTQQETREIPVKRVEESVFGNLPGNSGIPSWGILPNELQAPSREENIETIFGGMYKEDPKPAVTYTDPKPEIIQEESEADAEEVSAENMAPAGDVPAKDNRKKGLLDWLFAKTD